MCLLVYEAVMYRRLFFFVLFDKFAGSNKSSFAMPIPVLMRLSRRELDFGPAGQNGFTLIELIMVMVLLGVLAAYAAPRIFNRGDFDARGMHDMSMAYLRYAQKTAIAQRRTVCMTLSSSGISLKVSMAANTFGCASATAMNGPDGKAALSVSGVSYSAFPSPDFSFDGLGQPVDSSGVALTSAQTFTVAGAGRSITVEAGTGYVHD